MKVIVNLKDIVGLVILVLILIILGIASLIDKFKKKRNLNYSVTEVCPHDIAEIKVISTVGTCETSVLVCTECKKQITEPKTDCR